MTKQVIGTCGNCGGQVTVPTVWMGVNPPVPKCDSCHATVKNQNGPPLKMNPAPKGYQCLKLNQQPLMVREIKD